MTTRQVAHLARVETSTVRRWVAAGHLTPSVTTPGGQMRFDSAEVEQLLSTRRGQIRA
jgi:excisionase family DNA binding protein